MDIIISQHKQKKNWKGEQYQKIIRVLNDCSQLIHMFSIKEKIQLDDLLRPLLKNVTSFTKLFKEQALKIYIEFFILVLNIDSHVHKS